MQRVGSCSAAVGVVSVRVMVPPALGCHPVAGGHLLLAGICPGGRAAPSRKRRHDALRRFCAKDPGALDRPGQRGTMPQPGETDSVTTAWSDLYPRVLPALSTVISSGRYR